jgi:hypothetical protein
MTAIVTNRPSRATYNFGPGALESIKLTTWTSKHKVGKLRASGSFTVYCGEGGSHEVPINVIEWACDFAGMEPDDVAHELVGFGLDRAELCDCGMGS